MEENKLERAVVEELHRVLRFLRRRPAGAPRGGRIYRILEPIEQHEEVSTRELAEILDVRPSSLNEMLSRMEQDGLIMRRRDPQDQRVFLVSLTQEGSSQMQQLREATAKSYSVIGQILSVQEQQTLVSLCRKLANGLEEHMPPEAAEERHHHGRGAPEWR